MAEQENATVFRQKTLERISSPEQLADYLRVTNPGIWIILAAVIVLLAGIFVWAMVGTLETTDQARVITENHIAQVIPAGPCPARNTPTAPLSTRTGAWCAVCPCPAARRAWASPAPTCIRGTMCRRS